MVVVDVRAGPGAEQELEQAQEQELV